MKEDTLIERRENEESVFDGRLLHVRRAVVTLPNGHKTTRELIRHVGASAVIPVTEDGFAYVERQYRYPLDSVLWEVPAGKLDSKAEDPLEAAKRELLEETGLTAENWTALGTFVPTCAYSDEVISLYLARGLRQTERRLDDDEFLNVEKVPMTKLIEMVMDGTVTDGKTQTLILKAARCLGL